LAAFHLEKINKNQKDKGLKEGTTSIDLFPRSNFHEMQLLFPVYGVRKLGVTLKEPEMNVMVPIPFFKDSME
jgi:hypothetical protein